MHTNDRTADYEVVVVVVDYADASAFDYAGFAFVESHPTMNRIVIYYCLLEMKEREDRKYGNLLEFELLCKINLSCMREG